MTPQKQLFHHDPDNGIYGDCHRAALASILDLPLESVPHFMYGLGPDEGEEFERRQKEFLLDLGLVPISISAGGDNGLELILKTLGAQCSGIYYLLGGESATGCGHTVVCCGGEIVFDPSLTDAGIIGPMNDGLFWITFIGSAKAFKQT